MNRLLLALPILIFAPSSYADWRCDCTQVTASCTAEVAVEGNGIVARSNRKECSRIDYFIDGQPFVSVAVDGEAKEAWLPRTEQPEILIQSCQVCRDNVLAGSRSEPQPEEQLGTQAEPAEDDFSPIIEFEPEYPSSALARRQQGYVKVKVTVAPSGAVRAVKIVESRPSKVFDRAAIEAVRRWRYPPRDPGAKDIETEEKVEFQLGSNTLQSSASGEETSRYNQCIRVAEQGWVDRRVEMQLENVCSEPLIVHTCVEGARDATGRWVCGPRGRRGTLLVRSGDQRAGQSFSMHTKQGVRSYSYAERQSLYRASNGQYWWVACGVLDAGCNEAALRWQAAFHDRPVSLDPGESTLARVSGAR